MACLLVDGRHHHTHRVALEERDLRLVGRGNAVDDDTVFAERRANPESHASARALTGDTHQPRKYQQHSVAARGKALVCAVRADLSVALHGFDLEILHEEV